MFTKEQNDNKIIYKDINNNEIEVLLNMEPIIDVDNKYSLSDLLKNKELLDVIKELDGKIIKAVYVWKKETK